jgi:nucleotide sugar dehydrogenase
MTDKAFIIGNGTVGKATARALGIKSYYDLEGSNITLEEGSKKLFCFICLPTPTDEKGGQAKARLQIASYIEQLKEYGSRNIFVIRSTVIPGTCRALAEQYGVMVVSNPEFLTEDRWEEDAIRPRMVVIGADDVPSKNAVVSLWKPVKSKIRVETDTVTAETLKYAFNTFFVTKVVWANQLYDMCQKNGADYETIHKALHAHPEGSKNHFTIEHKEGRGAGGKCLPKDLKAFAKYSGSKLLKLVDELNDDYLHKSKKE